MRARKMLTERCTRAKAVNKRTTRGGRPVLIDRSIFIRKPLNYSTSSLSFSFPEFSVHRVVFSSPLSSMPESLIIPKPSPSINHRRFSSRHRRPLLFSLRTLLTATTIIRKTFEGTKVRTFVPSFSSLSLPLSPPLVPPVRFLSPSIPRLLFSHQGVLFVERRPDSVLFALSLFLLVI